MITSHSYADIVTNVNIHPTDKRIFVSLFDGTVSILDGTTFTQITSYTYPNTGNGNSIVFPKYQSFYYAGGYDGTAP
jgi:WD40 repeat protein